jgi:hypothetical protein
MYIVKEAGATGVSASAATRQANAVNKRRGMVKRGLEGRPRAGV